MSRSPLPHPKASILLVEDDDDTGEVMSELFVRDGWNAQWVRSGSEALQVFDSARRSQRPFPDVVVLDLGLPDMSGFDLAEALCRDPAAPPIVVMSAAPESELRRAGQLAGVRGLLRKPFALEGLRDLIDDAIAPRRLG